MIKALLTVCFSVLMLGACASRPPASIVPERERIESAIRLGAQALQSDQWQRAAEMFDEAGRLARSVDQRGLEAIAALNLAWLEERSGQSERASARLQALADTPGLDAPVYAEIRFRQAKYALQQKNLDEARRRLDNFASATDVDPTSRIAILRARLDFLSGDYASALQSLRAIDANRNSESERAGALQLEARIRLAQGLPHQALERLNEAYGLGQIHAVSHLIADNLALQARAYAAQGDAARARWLEARSDEVCRAWLQRFAGSPVWRPPSCLPF